MNYGKKFLLSAILLMLANNNATSEEHMDDINRQISELRTEIKNIRARRDAIVTRRLMKRSEYKRFVENAPLVDSLHVANEELVARAVDVIRRKSPGKYIPTSSAVFWVYGGDKDISSLRQMYDYNRRIIDDINNSQERINTFKYRVIHECDSVMYSKIDSCYQRMDSLLTLKFEKVR